MEQLTENEIDNLTLGCMPDGRHFWVNENTKIAYRMKNGELKKWFKIIRKVDG